MELLTSFKLDLI